jgi:hypothetical protein
VFASLLLITSVLIHAHARTPLPTERACTPPSATAHTSAPLRCTSVPPMPLRHRPRLPIRTVTVGLLHTGRPHRSPPHRSPAPVLGRQPPPHQPPEPLRHRPCPVAMTASTVGLTHRPRPSSYSRPLASQQQARV